MKKRVLAFVVLTVLAVAAGLWAQRKPAVAGSASASASPAEIEKHVETFLRTFYAWGASFVVKVDPPKASPIPALYEVPVQITYKGQSDKATVYVSHDGRYMVRGTIDKLLANPFAETRKLLEPKLGSHPSVGPAKACVTVAEFSDYECPHCRELSDILKQVEPRYPQVRFTFFDFPLEQIHPWSMNAALAARCVYEQKPAAYAAYRRSIFENQDQITPDDASDRLMSLATAAGVDASAMQACMASPATRREVDADLAFGKELKVNSTPTVFVNGRPLIGGNEPLLEQFISYELSRCPVKK